MARWQWGLLALFGGALVWPVPLNGAISEMQNEDVIVGELRVPLTVATALGGELKVPLEDIVSMEGDRFTFADGTALRGRIAAETLVVQTRFGELSLPIAQLRAVKNEKQGAGVTPTAGTIFEIKSGDIVVGELHDPVTLELAFGSRLEVPPKARVSFDGERFATV